jgi:hypothetical protein
MDSLGRKMAHEAQNRQCKDEGECSTEVEEALERSRAASGREFASDRRDGHGGESVARLVAQSNRCNPPRNECDQLACDDSRDVNALSMPYRYIRQVRPMPLPRIRYDRHRRLSPYRSQSRGSVPMFTRRCKADEMPSVRERKPTSHAERSVTVRSRWRSFRLSLSSRQTTRAATVRRWSSTGRGYGRWRGPRWPCRAHSRMHPAAFRASVSRWAFCPVMRTLA